MFETYRKKREAKRDAANLLKDASDFELGLIEMGLGELLKGTNPILKFIREATGTRVVYTPPVTSYATTSTLEDSPFDNSMILAFIGNDNQVSVNLDTSYSSMRYSPVVRALSWINEVLNSHRQNLIDNGVQDITAEMLMRSWAYNGLIRCPLNVTTENVNVSCSVSMKVVADFILNNVPMNIAFLAIEADSECNKSKDPSREFTFSSETLNSLEGLPLEYIKAILTSKVEV